MTKLTPPAEFHDLWKKILAVPSIDARAGETPAARKTARSTLKVLRMLKTSVAVKVAKAS